MKRKLKKAVAILLVLAVTASLMMTVPLSTSALTSADFSISENGIKFICDREKFSAKCYYDYTQSSIGYGTKCTGCAEQPHAPGLHSITKEEALAEMKSQINSTYAVKVKNQTVGITMNQNQFDALVSLAYNTGGGTTIIAKSPLVAYLKGQLSEGEARAQYSRYKIKAGGEVNDGLIKRRNAEANLFFQTATPTPTQNDNFVYNMEGFSTIPGGVHIQGWCYDKRNTNQTLQLHVYFGGPAGDANAEGNPFTSANVTRTDVDNVHHCGANHGFDSDVTTSKTGNIGVYIYAVNPSNGESTLMFSFGADIPPYNDFSVHMDNASAVPGGVFIEGWCYDKNHTGQTLNVHTYIGGPAGTAGVDAYPNTVANKARTDVDNAYHCGPNHGFSEAVYTSKRGSQPVYVYAVNPVNGGSTLIHSFTANITNPNNPEGAVDDVIAEPGRIRVRGWSFDKDDISANLDIHVYIGGNSNSQNAEGHCIKANTERTDVDNVHHCGTNHGFDTWVPTSKTGTQEVHIYGINVKGGENVFLGTRTVNIPADTEKPNVTEAFAAPFVGEDGYRVYIKAEDNVGIFKVMVGTWVNGATPPDESEWQSAIKNSDGYWYVDVLRSEQSATGNSFYNNQFYIYDWAGNKRFGTANMDYRVTSTTGKSVEEGEYRICPASDETKGLDIYGAGTGDNSNVDIYPNLTDSKQTFNLTYIGDGYYTIFNTNANKPIDVFGDTYISGTNVSISSYHEGANQQWIIKPDENSGYYSIIARSNGLALTVQDNGNVAVCTNTGAAAQKWRLRRMIKNASYTIIDPVINKGEAPVPNVSVKMDGVDLVENVDYQVTVNSYANGSGTVTVSGIGNYCESKTLNFSYTEKIIGDVDFDGEVTVSDATELQKYLADFCDLTANQLEVSDMNRDGKVNIRDVMEIQRKAAGFV